MRYANAFLCLVLVGVATIGCTQEKPEPPKLDAAALEAIERADAKIAAEESEL